MLRIAQLPGVFNCLHLKPLKSPCLSAVNNEFKSLVWQSAHQTLILVWLLNGKFADALIHQQKLTFHAPAGFTTLVEAVEQLLTKRAEQRSIHLH